MNKENDKQPQADSVDVFVPTHPPVVVPHSWRGGVRFDSRGSL